MTRIAIDQKDDQENDFEGTFEEVNRIIKEGKRWEALRFNRRFPSVVRELDWNTGLAFYILVESARESL